MLQRVAVWMAGLGRVSHCPPLSGMLPAALFISNFQVGGIGR
jgi:hypothetical protein